MNNRFRVLCMSLLLLCGVTYLTACSSESTSTSDEPVVTPAEAGITNLVAPTTAIPGNGGSVTVTFTAASAWTAMPGQAWCKVDKTNGVAGSITLTVSADANGDTENDRNSSIRITCGKQTETITVTQKFREALTLTADKVELGCEGGDFKVELKANVDFTCEIASGATAWLKQATTRATTTSIVAFTAAPNETMEKREAVINFKSATQESQVKVYQAGQTPTLVLSQTNVKVPGEGGEIAIEIQSNVPDYDMMLSDGADWIKPITTRALSSYTHRFQVEPNNTNSHRKAVITFTLGDVKEEVAVVQYSLNPVMEPVEFAAFPGAEGHGRNTVGGRGGKVYHVTNLNDSGEGSLRWALSKDGPKTIVFDVAGTIHLKSRLATGKDYLTIAGQTSPGGICLADYPFVINSSNVIIRFMRFRPGDTSGSEPDGLSGFDARDIIVDHCSVSWSVDECLSIYGMVNSTVQWCMASQALHNSTHSKKTHGYGGIWGGNHASFHHNLIAHCSSRTPRFGPRPGTQENEWVDARNNVYYNWSGGGCYGAEGMNINIVNNYYKPGPATPNKQQRYRIVQIGIRTEEYCQENPSYAPMKHKWGTFYIDGNKIEGNPEVTADNWPKGVYEQIVDKNVDYLWNDEVKVAITKTEPVIDAAGVTTHTADEAYQWVLARVGASNYRDILDEVIINDVKNGTATCDAPSMSEGPGFINSQKDVLAGIPALGDNPYPELKTDASRSITDTDGDGMPDDFEVQYKLNPNDASDGNAKNLDPAGCYTNLEMYLHDLVKDIMVLE